VASTNPYATRLTCEAMRAYACVYVYAYWCALAHTHVHGSPRNVGALISAAVR